MRYIIRRPNPTDLEQIRGFVADLDARLGTPTTNNLRQEILHDFNPSQRAVFGLSVQKDGDKLSWVCHTIELVAESEESFKNLSQQFQVGDLSHISASP